MKYKYKKLIWIMIGFFLACCYVHKVNALDYDLNTGFTIGNITINNTLIDDIWSNIEGKTQHELNSAYSDTTYIYHRENLPFMYVQPTGYGPLIFFSPTNVFDDYFYWNNNYNYNIALLDSDKVIRIEIYNGDYIYEFDNSLQINNTGGYYPQKSITSFDFYINDILTLSQSFTYVYTSNPDYLNGYQKITLTTDDKYYMLSGLSNGSIFIPLEDFNSSGGRLSYYDNDLSSQPYTSYIQDYTVTSDGLYARQDFNLNNYYGADFVMFSKYIYLEGEDNVTYDIWVPEDITYSNVTITPNSSGGNDFEFQYKDTNGDIQNQTTSSIDLTPPQPLLSDIFNNFTTNYYGLSSIILSPISFLEGVNNSSCSALSIPLPYGLNSFSLPCMTPLYQAWLGDFFTLYQTIISGFIAYYVGLGYFNLIKGLKDPSDDRIEVIHL